MTVSVISFAKLWCTGLSYLFCFCISQIANFLELKLSLVPCLSVGGLFIYYGFLGQKLSYSSCVAH